MTPFLKAADLTQDTFLELIESLDFGADPSACYVWLEAPDGWTLDYWNWQSGTQEELRWYGAGREIVKKSLRDCLTVCSRR